MRVGFRHVLNLSWTGILWSFACLGAQLHGAPQLVAIIDGESYEQESSAVAPVLKEFAFAVGVEFGTAVSGVDVTVQPPGRLAVAVPRDDATSFYLERTFTSRALRDVAFPDGRYIVATSGTQTDSFSVDLTVAKPNPPRLVTSDFYAGEDLSPGRLVIDWTRTGSGDVFAFSQIRILTEAGDVVASTPDYAPGVSGSGLHWEFRDVPRADTYIGEIAVTHLVFADQGSTELLVGRSAVTRFRIRRLPPPDRAPPQIVAITPRSDGRVADGYGPITLVFDKPMNTSSRRKIDVRRYQGYMNWSEMIWSAGEVSWSGNGRTAVVSFTPPLAPGFYAIEAAQFGDIAGNAALGGEQSFVVGTPRPWIIAEPSGPVVTPGATVTYRVIAKGPDISYQWFRDGRAVAGATSAVWRPLVDWSFPSPRVEVEISNASGRERPGALTFPLMVAPADYPLLTNLSIRNRAGSSERPLVVGFVVSGASTGLPLLLRGIGPGLVPFGVSGVLPDPQIQVQGGGAGAAMLADDFDGTPSLISAAANAGAFPLTPPSKDAVLAYSGEPGGHTATITTGDGREGIALAEIYRIGAPLTATLGPVLSNISARAFAGPGGDALLAGFTISPSRYRKGLLIRGIGPGLAPFGVTGTLRDPQILLYRSDESGVVAQNDDWESQGENNDPVAPFAEALGAFTLQRGSKDAALIVYLRSGNYTVQVVGADGGTGVALIEIYEL